MQKSIWNCPAPYSYCLDPIVSPIIENFDALEKLKNYHYIKRIDKSLNLLISENDNPISQLIIHNPLKSQDLGLKGNTVYLRLNLMAKLNEDDSVGLIDQIILLFGQDIDRLIVECKADSTEYDLLKKMNFFSTGKITQDQNEYEILSIDIRYNVRALLFNTEEELLLMKIEDDITTDDQRLDNHFWVTIGGKIEPGETDIEAIKREVFEEIGVRDISIDKLAFYGEHTLFFHQFPIKLYEKFYLVHCASSEFSFRNQTLNEKNIFRDLKWWSKKQLLQTEETIYPRSLPVELSAKISSKNFPKKIKL